MAVQTSPLLQHRANLRAVFRICNAFNLTRGHRMEIATVLLNRNVETFGDLSAAEARRLRDGFEVAVLVCQIQLERRRGERV